LSETFILNEVIGVERLGVRLQISTIKETEDKVPNAKASRVHAPVTCLSIEHNLTATGRSSVRQPPVILSVARLGHGEWGTCCIHARFGHS